MNFLHPSLKYLLLLSFIIFNTNLNAQGSISATYTAGDIPTGYNAGNWDPACNGTSTTLSLTLPSGVEYEVLGIDVSYDMVANANLWMSGQNSQIHFQNNNISEASISEGMGDFYGTESYSRNGITIANGSYAGSTVLIFEMRAWRDYQTSVSGCTTSTGKVANTTWTITLHYGPEVTPPRVGINNAVPKATLDVGGEIIVGSDGNPPQTGMIKWDAQNQDFIGYDGVDWKSLTLPNELPIDPFPNSVLLNSDQKTLLNKWVGKEKQKWQLCYKRSVDGASSNTFHDKCNDLGPTIVIIKLDNNRVFGGYTAVGWSINEGYFRSENAFIFSIDNEKRYPIARTDFTGYNQSGYGPTFGGGHDIYINGTMNFGYSNFPYSYAFEGSVVTGNSIGTQELCGLDRITSALVLELEVWYLAFN